MDIVFISGVELGRYAVRGIIDSTAFREETCRLKAIFSLSEEKAHKTSGFRPFDDIAATIDVPLHKVDSIKTKDILKTVSAYAPDLLCIIGWSELAPPELLDIPKMKHESTHRHSATHGCIGIHPTLLPQGRGRAPIPWSLIYGLERSGVTLFYLEEGADTGDIVLQSEFLIDLEDDASTVYSKVADLHYELMKEAMPLLASGTAPRTPQNPEQATVWKRRKPEDGEIDWSKTQMELYNWIRALTYPYPGAFTHLRGRKLTIWKSLLGKEGNAQHAPGTILGVREDGIIISCRDGELILQKLGLEGEQSLDGPTFATLYELSKGMTPFN